MLLFGTIPDKNLHLTVDQGRHEGDFLFANGQRFSRTQGTGARISAALAISNYLKMEAPTFLSPVISAKAQAHAICTSI